MPAERATIAASTPAPRSPDTRLPPNNRSAVTNGNASLLPLTPAAVNRRRRDLIDIFGQEVGGFENLPAAGQQVVQSLAQVSVDIEVMTAERAAGRPVDPELFLAHVNSQGRLLKTLRTHYRPKTTRSLGSHLAATYATPGVAK